MALPVGVKRLVEAEAISDLPGALAIEEVCEGAKFHSPTPMILNLVPLIPSGWGESVEGGEFAVLCGTCSANLRVLQSLLWVTKGDLAWNVRREFGNLIRALGQRGWEQYRAGVTDG